MDPCCGFVGAGSVNRIGQLPNVTASVIEVQYLDRTVEVLDGKIPDPGGTVTEDYDSAGTVQPAADRLCVNALAKVIRSLNRAYIGCGFIIPERSAFVVDVCLSEDTSELDLASFSSSRFVLAVAFQYQEPKSFQNNWQ